MEEPIMQTEQTPAQQPAPAAGPSEEMARELEALREEKRRRALLEEAQSLLEERGIAPHFAPFVLGEDGAATRRRVEQFDRQLSDALQRHLASHLPPGEPKDFSVSRPAARRRGIRRL